MSRIKRSLYRLSEILDYRTFVVAGAFFTLLLVGYLVLASIQQAHDATEAQNRSRIAASRRIDLLNNEINRLQHSIAAGSEQRGDLAAKLAALAEQVRQLGGRPVVMVTNYPTRTSPKSAPSPSPSSTPKPRPTSSPKPSPSPSPTCRLVVAGRCIALK